MTRGLASELWVCSTFTCFMLFNCVFWTIQNILHFYLKL